MSVIAGIMLIGMPSIFTPIFDAPYICMTPLQFVDIGGPPAFIPIRMPEPIGIGEDICIGMAELIVSVGCRPSGA